MPAPMPRSGLAQTQAMPTPIISPRGPAPPVYTPTTPSPVPSNQPGRTQDGQPAGSIPGGQQQGGEPTQGRMWAPEGTLGKPRPLLPGQQQTYVPNPGNAESGGGVMPQNPNVNAALQAQQTAAQQAWAAQQGPNPYTGGNIAQYGNVGRPGWDTMDPTYLMNPSAYQYGGQIGGATAEENRYQGMADQAQGRAATEYGNYQAGIGQANQARDAQMQGLGYLQNQINGIGPSVAQQQMNAGLSNARLQQASIAASARGGGANLAAAQQSGANAAAGLSGQAVQQSALLRAQEQANAINSYGTQAAGLRGADFQGAQLAAGQQQQANQQQQQWEGQRANVMQTQQGYQQNAEIQNAAREASLNGLNFQQQQANQQHSDNTAGAIMGMLGTVGMGVAMAASDERAKKDIARADADIDDAMGKLKPFSFKYKDGARFGEGEQTGIMAQHLEASRAGRGAIAELPDGTKVVKAPQAATLALAGLARLNDRLSKIEDRNARK